MSSQILKEYTKTFSHKGSITPAILSYQDALEVVHEWQNTHGNTSDITDIMKIKEEYIDGLFFYTTPEDKTEFPIQEVRRFIGDTASIPYAGKNLYLLVGIETASNEAMNALLKILEDTPEHAIILLVVSDKEALLETIQSRTLDLFQRASRTPQRVHEGKIKDFFGGSPTLWIETLFSLKPNREDAIDILIISLESAPGEWIPDIEEGIFDLFTTYETPRNILDKIFLSKAPTIY